MEESVDRNYDGACGVQSHMAWRRGGGRSVGLQVSVCGGFLRMEEYGVRVRIGLQLPTASSDEYAP
jgi:hypothetical protein